MNPALLPDCRPGQGGQALDEPAVVAALAALAQPARLRLFRALVVAGP